MEENEKNYLDWEGLLEYHRNLETKLSEKANTEDLADVATSGDYNDLDNTPTNVSLFTNDAGYMTSEIDNTNGHDYVEIGGIKWATMNVGASKITDIGLYFQWGDILGYTSEEVGVDKNFTWEDYKFNPSGDGTTFSKYNSTDLKTSLDTEDDAAANAWGSDWRVPSTSELQTLSQAVNISWIDNYQESGVPGLILTDKEDSSKVLFLPATGVCNDGSIIDDDTTGFYWSKSLGNTDNKGLGLGFDKTNGTTWEYSNSRSLGFAIRPVLEGPAKRTIMGVTQLEKDKWNSKVSGIKIGESGEVISPVNGVVIIPNQSNVQADWNQNDSSADDFIKNKPGMGVANGLATLDSTGKVPSSQLPSYVDDVIEGYYHGEEDPQSGETVYNMYEDDEYTILITPESGKIYLDIPTSNSYRWSGSQYVLIGAPYDLPIASANTLGGVKVGSNLSIDQNGVLSAAAAANEVQIGGETPSSSSDVEIFIDTTEDATAEVYTKQQQDGKFIVIKDLNAAPTESTLTYTENGTVKNFKQGDEVRVPDQDADNGYTFYKLYELTTSGNTTTAVWDKLGAGSGGGTGQIGELAIINLTSNQEDKSDLIGATVKIFNTDDPTEIFLETTWQGTAIELEIQVPINYTVQVGSVTNYYIASTTQSYSTRTIRTRNIIFTYYTEVVTVTVNTNAEGVTAEGQVITIDGVNITIPASGEVSKKVAFGTSYTISVNSKNGYNTPSNLSYIANSISRTATMTYTKILDGVFAITTTGDLVQYANINRSSPSSYVGVAIKDTSKNMSFFIDKRFQTGSAAATNVGNFKAWSAALYNKDQPYLTNISTGVGDGQSIYTAAPAETRTNAFNAYNNGETGVANTTNLVNDSNASSENASNNAAKYCRSIANPVTGSYDGYLASLAEWIVVNDNQVVVNQILNAIGGVALASTNSGYNASGNPYTYYCTSSEYNLGNAWNWTLTSSLSFAKFLYDYKNYAPQHGCARPFFPLT